jgi:hypothetical protein
MLNNVSRENAKAFIKMKQLKMNNKCH